MEKKFIEHEGCHREIEIHVSNEELQPYFEKAYFEAQQKINLKGFRKGKTPINMLKKLYGKQIETDTLENVAEEYFNKLIEDDKIHIVGQPKLTNIEKIDSGAQFNIKYEILPDFQIANYKELIIDEPVHTVTDEEIDEEIRRICINNGNLTPHDNISDEQHIVSLELQEIDESTQVPIIGVKNEKIQVFLSDKSVIPELRDALIGKSIDDSIIFKPHDYDPNAPNQTYKMTIVEIQQLFPVEFDNAFVEKYSKGKFLTTEEFREEIGFQIQENWDNKSRQQMEDQLVTKLVDMNDFKPPEVIVEQVMKAMVEDIKKRYKDYPEASKLSFDSFGESLRPLAERTVKWELIRNKIVEIEQLQVEDHDIEPIVEYEAQRLSSDKDAIRVRLMQNKQFIDNILSKKVMDFLLDFTETNEVEFEHNHIHEHLDEDDDDDNEIEDDFEDDNIDDNDDYDISDNDITDDDITDDDIDDSEEEASK